MSGTRYFKPCSCCGFTLVEAVITTALLGIVALTGMQINASLTESTSYGSDAQAYAAFATTLRNRLRYSDSCTSALGTSSGLNKAIDRPKFLSGRQSAQISIRKAGGSSGEYEMLEAGKSLSQAGLKIDDLKFTEVSQVEADVYLAGLQIAASSLKTGRKLKPMTIANVLVTLSGASANSSLTSCGGPDSKLSSQICSEMACEWNAAANSCQCPTVSSLCPVGDYPTAFQSTGPVCQKLGGAPCGTNEYLVGVGLGTSTCAPIAAAAAPSELYGCTINFIGMVGFSSITIRCDAPMPTAGSGCAPSSVPNASSYSWQTMSTTSTSCPTGVVSVCVNSAGMGPGYGYTRCSIGTCKAYDLSSAGSECVYDYSGWSTVSGGVSGGYTGSYYSAKVPVSMVGGTCPTTITLCP